MAIHTQYERISVSWMRWTLLSTLIAGSCAMFACGGDDDDGGGPARKGGGDTTQETVSDSQTFCSNSCRFAFDDVCDDGGPGAEFAACVIGTDCFDCGPITF